MFTWFLSQKTFRAPFLLNTTKQFRRLGGGGKDDDLPQRYKMKKSGKERIF